VRAPDQVKGPMPAGTRGGSVTVFVDGRPMARRALVTAAAVPDSGTFRVLFSVLGVPLTLLAVVAILLAAVLVLQRFRVRLKVVR